MKQVGELGELSERRRVSKARAKTLFFLSGAASASLDNFRFHFHFPPPNGQRPTLSLSRRLPAMET